MKKLILTVALAFTLVVSVGIISDDFFAPLEIGHHH